MQKLSLNIHNNMQDVNVFFQLKNYGTSFTGKDNTGMLLKLFKSNEIFSIKTFQDVVGKIFHKSYQKIAKDFLTLETLPMCGTLVLERNQITQDPKYLSFVVLLSNSESILDKICALDKESVKGSKGEGKDNSKKFQSSKHEPYE